MNYESRQKQIQEYHEVLLTLKNEPEELGNGIFERYQHPILTAEHTPLEWRYDFNKKDNPYLMQRIMMNAVLNAGAIKMNGRYLLVCRVEGADRKVALVADVYTANADNNPSKSILFEAVGDADEIFVVVEIDGYLYLTRGAVLSYREFQQAIDEPRLTDEEWQKMLEEKPRKGVPEWMKPILVPLKKMPEVNEEYFYSSGC